MFYYGKANDAFEFSLKHFGYQGAQFLSHCTHEDFHEKICLDQIKEHLQALHKESIILVLNSELLMINAVPKRVIKRVAESKRPFHIMSNENWVEYGVNILGSREALVTLNSLKDYTIDSEKIYFDNVDEWKENSIGLDYSFNLNSVRDLTKRDTPLVLMQKPLGRNKFDHFVNLMQKNTLEKIPKKNLESKVLVCLEIRKTLFFQEFLNGFLNQDYPRSLIDLLILSVPERKIEMEKSFNSVTWKNVETGKVSCFEEAQRKQSDFILFLDSSVILEENSTLTQLISADLDFVAPMIRTGSDAQIQRLCDHGWNQTESNQIRFPPNPNTRAKRGLNFVLYETLVSANSSVNETINFWTPYTAEAQTEMIGQPYLSEVEKGGFRTFTRAESVRNIFLLNRKVFETLLTKEKAFFNQPDFDDLVSKEVRKLVPLTVLTDQNYGQLVDLTDDEESSLSEFYRIFENHELWEKRYIKDKVAKFVKRQSESNQINNGLPVPDYGKETKCTDVLEYDIFTEEFLRDIKVEMKSGKEEFEIFKEQDWPAILNFYVFSQLCDAKIYLFGVTNILEITEKPQFLPKLTEVETEINVLLPLNEASDKLQLTFIR